MRTTVIKTAVKMPFYSISYSSSSYSASSSVFRNTEKLSCANEVSASKQASKLEVKSLLLSDRSLPDRQFYYFSDSQGIESLYLEELYQSNFTAAKSSYGLSRLFLI